MSQEHKTYWIDLSDLSQWKGHYTGIQRVVFNIAKYYAERPDAKFFVFDKPGTGFYEVDFDIINEPPDVGTEGLDDAPAPLKAHVVRRLARSVPSRYRQRVPASAKIFLRKSYQTVRAIKYKSAERVQHSVGNFKLENQARFAAEDTILILGSAWADPNMMPALVNSKQEIGFKLVQVIYDLIPILMPYLFGEALYPIFTRYMFDVVANSDALVAISQSTKKDVLNFSAELKVPEVSVGVVRLGDEFAQNTPRQPQIDVKAGNFILCVGTMEIRKNHQLLYYAYKEAKQRDIELPKLVIVGRRGWLTEDLNYALQNDLDVKDSIIILNDASDAALTWLYRNCRFTVYPALYEGWGLPIAESLAYGKACLASNTSSMVEIAPELVEHFSPYDSLACLNLLHTYSSDDELIRIKEAAIRKEYGDFSWQNTYAQFSKFVESLED